MLTITETAADRFQVIRLAGRLDSTTSEELEEYLGGLDFSAGNGIIFEMTSLDYISSAGLRVILNTSKKCRENGTRLLLCGCQDHILEIFEISGFDSFLAIYPSLAEALAA